MRNASPMFHTQARVRTEQISARMPNEPAKAALRHDPALSSTTVEQTATVLRPGTISWSGCHKRPQPKIGGDLRASPNQDVLQLRRVSQTFSDSRVRERSRSGSPDKPSRSTPSTEQTVATISTI